MDRKGKVMTDWEKIFANVYFINSTYTEYIKNLKLTKRQTIQ